jgi:hypothetical protein
MDIEKLIEQLKRNTDCWTDKVHGYADLRLAAATALSTLQAENEKLRAELDEKEKYYDQMIDALAATDSAELEQVKREKIRIPEGYALVKLELLEELDNFRDLGPIDRLRELAQADKEGRCVVLPGGGYKDKDGENALKSAMNTCFYHNNPVTRFIADAVAEKLTRDEAALRRDQE